MTIQQLLQSTIDSTEYKAAGIQSLAGTFAATGTVTVTPTPAQPPPPPTQKRIVQKAGEWAHDIGLNVVTPTVVTNETISDGGFLHTLSIAPVSITHCQNEKGNQASGGHYFVMLWPPAASDGTQRAVTKCTIDATGCTIYQGIAEAAIRGKCDDFQMTGGTIVAHLQPNGNQIKPIVEIRHGKSWKFTDVTFDGGWPEIGEQTTKQPDGSNKLETSQQVGTVVFDHCTFTRWENKNSKSVLSRKPGVQKIVLTNCIGPDGKTFNQTL